MKCPNCGYEIEKPNLKTCPLCGSSLNLEGKVEHPTQNVTPINEQRDIDIPEEVLSEAQSVNIPENQQTICPRCHEIITLKSKFCPNCGLDIRKQEDSIQREVQTDIEKSQSDSEFLNNEQELMQCQYDKRQHIKEAETENDKPTYSESKEFYDGNDDNDEESLQMGGYYPYSDDINMSLDSEESTSNSISSTWLTIIISTIISILLGAILFYLTQ